MIMTIVAISLVVLFAAFVLRSYYWQFIAVRYGTEAEASVSWIEKYVGTSQGGEFPMYTYYVIFRKDNGMENEAKLLNPKKKLVTGSKVKIRYLPEKDNLAVLTEIIDE